MNRRDLLRRGPLALLGIGAMAVGVKATPPPLAEDTYVTYQMNDKHMKSVLKMFMRDYINNGRMREIVERSGK